MDLEKQIFADFRKIGGLPYGAEFFKADLHFHTPASSDARGGNRYGFNPYKDKYPKDTASADYKQKVLIAQDHILKKARKIAADIVKKFREECLSVVAVTDHNSLGTIWSDPDLSESNMDLAAPTWYELIDDEAQKLNQAERKTVLTILPGVEISTSGVHILAIFPPSKPRRQVHFIICDLLHETGFAIEDWGNLSKVGKLSPYSTIELITKKGGVPILAHIDGSDQSTLNLYKINSGAMKDVLCNKNLFAVEIVEPKKFTRIHKEVKSPLKDYISDLRRKNGLEPLAYFQGSDAHQIKDIAKRHTFVKMTESSFSGFSTALQMPGSRIRISDFFTPVKSGFYIHSMKIRNAQFKEQHFLFNHCLNCVTGKKLTGKSSLFQFIQAGIRKEIPCDKSVITLYIEKIVNLSSEYYAFHREGNDGDIQLYKLNQTASKAEKIDIAKAAKLKIIPGFYDADRMEKIIESKTGLNGFLIKYFGNPTEDNIRRLNKMFLVPRFLRKNPVPLLLLKKEQNGYKLLINTRWHEDKEKLTDFFKLNKSMRRATLMCFIIISSNFGPTIIHAPETQFDNEDIANILVPIIKHYKNEQQIILFTSNSLLAVNSDPDNYILLEAMGNQFKQLISGFAIDDRNQKDKILNIMEGNYPSYIRRGVRYKSGS